MKRFYSILLFSTLLIVFAFADTKIIAHRGFSSAAPENTLAAFREAIAVGADFFELDVRQSRDGKLVVIHDHALNRVSSAGDTGKVAEMTLRELRKARVGYSRRFKDQFKREGIPTLRRALYTAKNKIPVCVEIKVPDIEAAVLKTIYNLKMEKQVIIFAFDYEVLKKIRELDAEIPLLYLRGSVDRQTLDQAEEIQASAIGAGRATAITGELLAQMRAKGLELWQWTVNDIDEIQRLLDIGIDGIITDYPDRALELREAKSE